MNPIAFYWHRWFSRKEEPVNCNCERCKNSYTVRGKRNNTGLCFACSLDIIARNYVIAPTPPKSPIPPLSEPEISWRIYQ
jgi:hypothetical protein